MLYRFTIGAKPIEHPSHAVDNVPVIASLFDRAFGGVAYAAGPSYNHARLTERRAEIAWEAIGNAKDRIENTSPVERDLIEALSQRFVMPYPFEDDSHLDQAYADAMAEVWERYPEDADVGMLYAEALMVRTPWALYNIDREPAEETVDHVVGRNGRIDRRLENQDGWQDGIGAGSLTHAPGDRSGEAVHLRAGVGGE